MALHVRPFSASASFARYRDSCPRRRPYLVAGELQCILEVFGTSLMKYSDLNRSGVKYLTVSLIVGRLPTHKCTRGLLAGSERAGHSTPSTHSLLERLQGMLDAYESMLRIR